MVGTSNESVPESWPLNSVVPFSLAKSFAMWKIFSVHKIPGDNLGLGIILVLQTLTTRICLDYSLWLFVTLQTGKWSMYSQLPNWNSMKQWFFIAIFNLPEGILYEATDCIWQTHRRIARLLAEAMWLMTLELRISRSWIHIVVFFSVVCCSICMYLYTGWWFGTFFIFPYMGNSHPT